MRIDSLYILQTHTNMKVCIIATDNIYTLWETENK